MSNVSRPLPPLPPAHKGQRSLSLDVGEASSSDSSALSTPSLSDDCRPPSEERSIRSSISLPVMPAAVTVKFAPLPEIGQRSRRTNQQLGVAARSRMLQQKRDSRVVQRHPRAWSEDDDHPVVFIPDEVQEEDPLEVLGRFIADKSKSWWRRVASKAKQPDGAGGVVSETTTVGEERKPAPSRRPNREDAPSSTSSGPPKQEEDISKTNGGGAVTTLSRGNSA
ncbi:hypothetical protein BC826DRAFT_275755 [Russula brevipes]|nr:hypothetical protein BC826DRAFT_275755 [Russula brevipes]